MSKSYGKYKNLGIATGSNTEWYRDRIRKVRNKNKHRIKNILSNFNTEDFDDAYIPYKIPKKDTWREPTDGTVRYTAKDVERLVDNNGGNHFGMYVTKDKKIKK